MKILNGLIKSLLLGIVIFVISQALSYYWNWYGVGTPIEFYKNNCGLIAYGVECRTGFLIDKFLLDLVICLVLWIVFRLIAIKTSNDGIEKLRWYELLVMIPLYFCSISSLVSPFLGVLCWLIMIKIIRHKTLNRIIKIFLVIGILIYMSYLLAGAIQFRSMGPM